MESGALKVVNLVKRSEEPSDSVTEGKKPVVVTRAPKSRPPKRPRTLAAAVVSDDECSIVTPQSWVSPPHQSNRKSSDDQTIEQLSNHTSTVPSSSFFGSCGRLEPQEPRDSAMSSSSMGSEHEEPRQWGVMCTPKDLRGAIFSKDNSFQVHEVVVVTRNSGEFCYARVLERNVENLRGVSSRNHWIRVGLKSTNKSNATTQLFKKTMPAVLIGKLPSNGEESPSLNDKRTATIGDLLDFIVDEAGGSAGTATLMRQARALIMQQVQFLTEVRPVDCQTEQQIDPKPQENLPLNLSQLTEENLTRALGDYCKAQVTIALQLARRLNDI